MIFQGPSLTQIGMNPLYRARIPSVLIVCKQTKESIKSNFNLQLHCEAHIVLH